MPCRHLFIPESFNSISDYWRYSENLKKLRKPTKHKIEPCIRCKLKYYCRPCVASNSTTTIQTENENTYCQLHLL